MTTKLIGFPFLILAALALFVFATEVDFGNATVADDLLGWVAHGLWILFASWAFMTLFESDPGDDDE